MWIVKVSFQFFWMFDNQHGRLVTMLQSVYWKWDESLIAEEEEEIFVYI